MKLSERLLAIVDEVPCGTSAADVGCDHAYTSVYLAENKIVSHVIAMDVKKGPLEKARINIKKAGLENEIEIRLSDGVQALKPKEVNTVIISGMGGNLMIKILSEGVSVINQTDYLILQPQTEIPEVRRFLHQIGFEIAKEKMLMEDGKYYIILNAHRNQKEEYSEEEYEFGKFLLESKNQVLKEYLLTRKGKMEGIIGNLKEYRENNEEKLRELEQEYERIKKGLNYFK